MILQFEPKASIILMWFMFCMGMVFCILGVFIDINASYLGLIIMLCSYCFAQLFTQNQLNYENLKENIRG